MRKRLVAAFMAPAGLALASSARLLAADPMEPLDPDTSWTSAPVPQTNPCTPDDTSWQCLARFRPPLPPLVEGHAAIRFTVGADGKADHCEHDRPAPQAVLGKQGCAYLASMRFAPSLAAQQFTFIIDWTLPETLPPDAETRPAVEASLLTDGYIRTFPDGETDPCDTLVCASDYPIGARRRESEGVATYHALVTREGRATLCWVSLPTVDGDLDLATCDIILSRARFKPAQKESGAPRMSIYTGRMHWVLED